MILGKLRRRISEICKKYPHMDISFTIPYHLPDGDYFTISVFDWDTRLTMKRSVCMSDFDAYGADFEEFEDALIMILDNVVEGVERSK